MPVFDIFEHPEFIAGCISCYNNEKVISSVPISKVEFDSYQIIPKSGGCYIHFLSNARNIKLNYRISAFLGGYFPHIGITAQRGISYSYRLLDNGFWRNYDCTQSKTDDNEVVINLNNVIPKDAYYEFMIFLPVNCFITGFSVSVSDDAQIKPYLKSENSKKALFLGGVSTYGVGINTTQFLLSNLIARRHADFEIQNVSFNTYSYWKYIERYSKGENSIVLTDYVFLELSFHDTDKQIYIQNLKSLLEFYIANSNAKVILWIIPSIDKAVADYVNATEELIASENISSRVKLCKSLLLDSERQADMYTYSKNYANDYGNVFIMQEIDKILR